MDEPFKVPNLSLKPLIVKQNQHNETLSEPEIIKENKTNLEIKKIESTVKIGCPYIEPKWSKLPDSECSFNFEVLKNGVIVEEFKNLQLKPYWVFGRLVDSDIVMAHPTISRFHAVLQFRPNQVKDILNKEKSGTEDSDSEEKVDEQMSAPKLEKEIETGWYLYDLNSTHGTFLNKRRIPNKTYVRVRVGHMIQLGASTRKFILQGPQCDEEEESEFTITELRQQRFQKEKERLQQIEEAKKEQEFQEKKREEEGISWGMQEDADEESDLTVNPYASTNNEDLYLEDPKKTLRGFFEREGYELEYKVDEMSAGNYICRVELPIDDPNGYPIVAEVSHKGKKKDGVFQCAMEACRILDRQGVLRRSTQEPKRRKTQNDSDSGDDDFLDRTGDIERKRIKKIAENKTTILSFDELKKEETDLLTQLSEIQSKIDRYQENEKSKSNAPDNDDDLDEFMTNLRHYNNFDKTEIRKLRFEHQRLNHDHIKLLKLIKIATPLNLPPLLKLNQDTKDEDTSSTSATTTKKINFPLYGKRSKLDKKFGLKKEEDVKIDEIYHKQLEEENFQQTSDIMETNVNQTEVLDEKVETPVEFSLDRDILQQEQVDSNKIELEPSISETLETEKKKRKNRQRNREKNRDNVDMNYITDEVDSEKYSEWVPPENQAGDGYTTLNDKFGY